MPGDERIRVIFRRLLVRDDSDWWGSGEFYFVASVDGNSIGDRNQNRNQIFRAVEGRWIDLPQRQWSKTVEIRNKSEVQVQFQVMEDDIFLDDDLGTVRHILRPTWRQRRFRHGNRFFLLEWRVELSVRGQFGWHGGREVFACRQQGQSHRCATVSGSPARHRLEICPVIPTPAENHLPPRPTFPYGTQGMENDIGYNFLSPGLSINTLSNPAVIPLLTLAQANHGTAAKIEMTYYYPNTLSFQDHDQRLVWSYQTLVGNPTLRFIAPPGGQAGRGTTAFVHATGDQEGEVELQLSSQGSVLAVYRALVRRMRSIQYRVNIINAQTGPSPRSTPQQAQEHIDAANIILRQIGLQLIPDPSNTVWDGAVPVPNTPGVFRLRVAAGITRNVNWTVQSVAGRGFIAACALNYNRNPGPNVRYVVNIAYIRSVIAIDHGGRTHRPYGLATDNPANGAGASITDDRTPSTSWVRPCGILPDGNAQTVTMTLRPAGQRNPNLAACWIRDFTNPTDTDRYAYVIAHEVGHILGLEHRGWDQGQALPDGVGYPPDQNIMFSDEQTMGQDFDIIQAKAAHRSPVLVQR
jgi:hypothetical protein